MTSESTEGDRTDITHLSVGDLLDVHDVIVQDDSATEGGLRDRGGLEFAVDHIEHGTLGKGPQSVHEKAFQLLRLVAASHSFIDGNKRTALASTVLFYARNGFELEYGEDLESMLILIGVQEDLVDDEVAVDHLAASVDRRSPDRRELRQVVERDIEQHRDVYDRLSES